MQCYCCATEMALARKVKLRIWRNVNPTWRPQSAAYLSYKEDMTYRWAIVCPECYSQLDHETGIADLGGRFFMSCSSCDGRAPVLDEAKYQAFQRRQAAQLGLEI
jgi:hypothetical protein